MKHAEKIIFCILFLFVIGFSVLANKKEKVDPLKILSVTTAYEINNTDDKTFYITLYLNNKNNLLKYTSSNNLSVSDKSELNYIELGYKSCSLEDTSIIYNNSTYYLYNLEVTVAKESVNRYINKAYLTISNSNYNAKVYLGDFFVKNDFNKNLNISKCYPIYNKVLGINNMVGLVLNLGNKYKSQNLEHISIGENFSGSSVVNLSDEISSTCDIHDFFPLYNAFDSKDTFQERLIDDSDILVPINYKNFYLLNNTFIDVTINGEVYTLDNITYHNTSTNLNDYSTILTEGEVNIL